jgi:hypothetical protein
MQYEADFAGTDGVPMDHVIFGAEPTFWLIFLLFVALAAWGGWAWGQREASSRPEAVESIWSAIDKALREAMQAHDGVLLGKAQEVLRVIDTRLGRTLKVAEGLAGPLKALREAVNGAVARPPGHGHAASPAEPAGQDPAEPAAPTATTSASASSGTVTIVNVGAAAQPGGDSHAAHPPAPSHREQLDRMRLAIAALNQHWRARDGRIAELRDAHDELSGH